MVKGKLLALAVLAVLLALGMTPIAKAQVEMFVEPEVVYTYPGEEVSLNGTIVNHDPVKYRCCLRRQLWLPDGRMIKLECIQLCLRPEETISHELTRTIPQNAPLGEYVLMFYLYERRHGELLAEAEAHIFVEAP